MPIQLLSSPKKKTITAKQFFFGLPGLEKAHTGTLPITPVAIPSNILKSVGSSVGKVAKFFAPKTPKGVIKLALGAPTIAGVGAGLGIGAKEAISYLSPKSRFEQSKDITQKIKTAIEEKDIKKVPKISEGMKTAGLAGAAAAAGTAGILAGIKGLEKAIKSKETIIKPTPEKFAFNIPSQPLPPVTSESLSPVTPAPLSPVKDKPSIKISNKPVFQIRVNATGIRKRFINQQINLK